jgi:hypothetical protein
VGWRGLDLEALHHISILVALLLPLEECGFELEAAQHIRNILLNSRSLKILVGAFSRI